LREKSLRPLCEKHPRPLRENLCALCVKESLKKPLRPLRERTYPLTFKKFIALF